MSLFGCDTRQENYDVVICGAGLAGLTLARQLKLRWPQISVLLLEKGRFPLEEATKIGESTVEIAAYYLGESLQLTDYFSERHYRKLGFRLFFGYPEHCLSQRPELGLSKFSPYDSYQIDRGRLENDLVAMNREVGIHLREGVSVKEIQLSEDQELHTITYKEKGNPQVHSARGRWVIDAMGRRRYLQKKLGLTKAAELCCSSAWFRVKGRFDVDDWVPAENKAWHDRVPDKIRWYSTNHLLGDGYWMWFIPLASGNTSVGIVSREDYYPFSGYYSKAKALAWLAEHQPLVAQQLEGREIIDFHKLKNYSYSSSQIFSEQRWACVGEAGVFPDPFYSPGSNFIGFENSITCALIADDLEGHICPNRVAGFNEYIISQNDWFTHSIQSAYSYHGRETVMFFNFMWTILIGWINATPQMFNHIYLDSVKDEAVRAATTRFFPLAVKMQSLFDEWAAKTTQCFSFNYINYLTIPFVKAVYNRNVASNKTLEELVADSTWGLQILEQFAHVIFLMAVEDCCPQARPDLSETAWYQTEAMSLNPDRWQADGLFNPTTEPQDPSNIYNQLRPCFTIAEGVRAP